MLKMLLTSASERWAFLRDGWNLVRVGDVATTSSGATPRAGDPRYYDGGTVPFLKIGDLNDGVVDNAETYVTEDAVRDARLRVLSPGMVLVAMYGSIGKTGILAFRATTNQAILALEVEPTRADPRFLYYVLVRAQPELIALGRGATQKNINKQIVEDLTIPLPPLVVQARIVDLLRNCDGLRTVARAELDAAAEVARRLRVRFFGDPELERVRLADLVKVTMGRQRSPKHQVGNHLVPYLRAANVKDGFLVLGDVLKMNFTPEEQEKFRLASGDVLVTEGCGSLSQIGANAVWLADLAGTVCFQNTLLRLRAVEGATVPSFVAHWARFAFESGAFAAVSSGTNIFHVGAERAAEMPFPALPVARQEELSEILDYAQASVASAQERVDTLDNLRAAVLSALLSGEHEIPESYDRFLTEDEDAAVALESVAV